MRREEPGPGAARVGHAVGPGPVVLIGPLTEGDEPMRKRVLLSAALVLALGCGSRKFAPVSGTVTLDGQPLAKAVVTVIPVVEKGAIDAGESSTGTTNEKGEFTLKSTSGKNGARVGKHKVSISMQQTKVGESDERTRTVELLPKRYNEKTELTWDVLSGGTDKADFPLKK